jgi:quercetin dioxygenase-like cupin family protein
MRQPLTAALRARLGDFDVAPRVGPMSRFFPTSDECARYTIFPGVQIQTTACEKMMISVVDLEPHSVVEEHSHPHEQVGMLLAGKAVFHIGEEQKTLVAGDVYCIPGHVKHKVIVLDEPARAIDIFTPPREEYR